MIYVLTFFRLLSLNAIKMNQYFFSFICAFRKQLLQLADEDKQIDEKCSILKTMRWHCACTVCLCRYKAS